MAYKVHHCAVPGGTVFTYGIRPHWYLLESWKKREQAIERARNYALDNGGYVNVMDAQGITIFGTDPAALDISIASGQNRYFTEPQA